MTTQDDVIRPPVAVRLVFVVIGLVQSFFVLGVLMLAAAGTRFAWLALGLFVVIATWLSVRSYRVRVVLGDVLVVSNPMRTYRFEVSELMPGLRRSDLVRVPVLAIGYASMGRWRELRGGLPLAATGDYRGARWRHDAATINEWLASRQIDLR